MAIAGFADQTAEDIFIGKNSKAARRLPTTLHVIARRKLFMLHAATNINDLRAPPSNHLEKLRGDLAGYYSIRVDLQYRIVFRFEHSSAYEVSIQDYHG